MILGSLVSRDRYVSMGLYSTKKGRFQWVWAEGKEEHGCFWRHTQQLIFVSREGGILDFGSLIFRNVVQRECLSKKPKQWIIEQEGRILTRMMWSGYSSELEREREIKSIYSNSNVYEGPLLDVLSCIISLNLLCEAGTTIIFIFTVKEIDMLEVCWLSQVSHDVLRKTS